MKVLPPPYPYEAGGESGDKQSAKIVINSSPNIDTYNLRIDQRMWLIRTQASECSKEKA